MRTINWGIIGTGKISSEFIKALKVARATNVVAVASRTEEKAIQFKKDHHIDTYYGSYEELLKDERVEVVYIGIPHSEHFKIASMCFQAGKHVLCEKPLTINEKESAILYRLAKENHCFFMEAMWTRFLPATNAVKEWVDNGRIGEVKFMSLNFGFQGEYDYCSRLFDPNLGGGALLDVGVYPIMYANYMMGAQPIEVKAMAHIGFSGVDEVCSLMMNYEHGQIVSANCSISANIGTRAEIIGTKGKIIIPDFYRAKEAFIYDEEGILLELFREDFRANGYEYEIEEVNYCLNEGLLESRVQSLQDSLERMNLLDRIRKQLNLKYPKELT